MQHLCRPGAGQDRQTTTSCRPCELPGAMVAVLTCVDAIISSWQDWAHFSFIEGQTVRKSQTKSGKQMINWVGFTTSVRDTSAGRTSCEQSLLYSVSVQAFKIIIYIILQRYIYIYIYTHKHTHVFAYTPDTG